MKTLPTQADIYAAFRDGAQVRAGSPTLVRSDDGTTHQLDLVAALAGRAAPWLSTSVRHDGRVIELVSGCGSTIAIDGRVSPPDTRLIRHALQAAPPDHARHSPVADAQRLAAGRIAVQIGDAHVRADVLSLVDGWEAVMAKVIEQTPEGVLGAAADDEITAHILIVTCPSTQRRYAHLVPLGLSTVAAARRWLMALPPGVTLGVET